MGREETRRGGRNERGDKSWKRKKEILAMYVKESMYVQHPKRLMLITVVSVANGRHLQLHKNIMMPSAFLAYLVTCIQQKREMVKVKTH